MQLTQAQRKGLLAILDRPLAIGCRLLSRGTFSALARRGLAERRRPEVLDGVAYGEAVITERGRKSGRRVTEKPRAAPRPTSAFLHDGRADCRAGAAPVIAAWTIRTGGIKTLAAPASRTIHRHHRIFPGP